MLSKENLMSATRALRPHTAVEVLERAGRLVSLDLDARAICRALLAPLLAEDATRGSDLLATLRAYYDCGQRVDLTADRLFLHRNSVRYRLDRIRLLLRTNIDDPQGIAGLMLALACERLATENRHAS
jgi:DNA-binding PucR family transcriptional regulator